MPGMSFSSPISYIGVLALIFGVFLIIAGLGIIQVEKVTVSENTKTWGFGVILALLGIMALLPDILSAFPQSNVSILRPGQEDNTLTEPPFLLATATTTKPTSTRIPTATTALITPEPTNTPKPTITVEPPTATPAILSLPTNWERINFVPGGTSHTFTTNFIRGVTKGYVLGIAARQHMFVTVTNGARIAVLDSGNQELVPISAGNGQWEVIIPQTGDYLLVIGGEGEVNVTIFIPPL